MAEPTPEELFNLGMLSYDKQDFSKARKYFEKACELNYAKGCGNLGWLYANGEGVEKNLKKAAQYFSKACDLKDGKGCFNLGRLYYYGEGVEKDFKKALALFEKACDLNNRGVWCFRDVVWIWSRGRKKLNKSRSILL
ncbi:tetratricopeptide repeat protein [Helicobacter pylori]|uniref:tetratricopeptide repeat protein n=1 Tax=Helicobacter pylori TaxID=210 RepID=UPI003D9C2E92